MALMTYAEAAVLAVGQAMEADPKVVVLGEDVGRGGIFGQYKGLQARFGAARVIDTPISEAAILGAGVGMALAGLRPVVEMRVVDFALCGMDELVNQAAKNRFMFGGQGRVPMVVRMPIGIWDASAAQHSQSFESWFAHLPGVEPAQPEHLALHRLARVDEQGHAIEVPDHVVGLGDGLQKLLGAGVEVGVDGALDTGVDLHRDRLAAGKVLQHVGELLAFGAVDKRPVGPW